MDGSGERKFGAPVQTVLLRNVRKSFMLFLVLSLFALTHKLVTSRIRFLADTVIMKMNRFTRHSQCSSYGGKLTWSRTHACKGKIGSFPWAISRKAIFSSVFNTFFYNISFETNKVGRTNIGSLHIQIIIIAFTYTAA
jgi:hypothetical protein